MDISIMLVFWSLLSLVRNSVMLAVYLLFPITCFFTVYEHFQRAGMRIYCAFPENMIPIRGDSPAAKLSISP